MTARDVGVHEGHVEAVPDRYVDPGDDPGILLDRDALARQRAFLDLQGRRDDHPAVRRHPVSRIDHDDVAGHDLVGGDL